MSLFLKPLSIEVGAHLECKKRWRPIFCKIDTIYVKVIALIFVVIVAVIIIIGNVAILFCFEILVVTA